MADNRNPMEIVRMLVMGARATRRGKETPDLTPAEVTPDGALKIAADQRDMLPTKTLAQLSPAATTLTTLYTVPSVRKCSVETVLVCNQNATAITFRLSVGVAGAADNVKQYLYYDVSVGANQTYPAYVGGLQSTDVLRCYSSATNVSFNVNGIEVV